MVNVFRATELRKCEVQDDKSLEEVPEGYRSAPKREPMLEVLLDGTRLIGGVGLIRIQYKIVRDQYSMTLKNPKTTQYVNH